MELHNWSDIKNRFKHNIILGNGASIAIDDRLSYHSLYEQVFPVVNRRAELGKRFVPDRFYGGGDFNDIYLRQQQDSGIVKNNQDKSPIPLNIFQRLLDALPPLPVHDSGCRCEICVGLKVCPECRIRSMYLDRKQRVWRCIKCHGYDSVRDPTQEHHSTYNDNPNIRRLEEWLALNWRYL